ncbi:TetR/AcrR family transcriptional regulator [Brevibacillus sp. B_LB10_24]|uniref:TetR/AcrR family transcriptional regulator n=1 Tax=Brevibacillus sp. B_LB10_24 TaxID=3380645 RepID=UPI0038B85534
MTQDQPIDRRQMLKDAAIYLVGKNGYDRTTIKEIARHCDVTVGVIYHYFESKKDLFCEALKDYCSSWEEIVPNVRQLPIEEGLVLIATRFIDNWRNNQAFIKIFATESFQNEDAHALFSDLLADAREKLSRYFECKIAEKEIAPADKQIMMNMFVSHFFTALLFKERLHIPILPEVDDGFIRASVRMLLSGWRQGDLE